MTRYGKFIVGLIFAWFVFALTASALGVFENATNRLGAGVGVAAGVPLLVFAAWAAASRRFREFVLSLNPPTLTAVQSWRLIGFTFVLLEAHRQLPARFALPAGYGDMLIGATATFVAWKLATPEYRGGFISWQALGILDLVTAVTLGVTAGWIDPQGVSMLPMTVLPLSLVPTFLVPLFLTLHVIAIAQARKWKAVESTRVVGGVLRATV